jgi:hypothetical protein
MIRPNSDFKKTSVAKIMKGLVKTTNFLIPTYGSANSSRLSIASHHVPQVGLGLERLAADLTAHILLCLVDGVLVAQETARRGQDGAANVARSVTLEARAHATMHLKREDGPKKHKIATLWICSSSSSIKVSTKESRNPLNDIFLKEFF